MEEDPLLGLDLSIGEAEWADVLATFGEEAGKLNFLRDL